MEIERYQFHKHPLTLCEIEGVDGPHCLVCDMGSFLDGYNCSNCEFHPDKCSVCDGKPSASASLPPVAQHNNHSHPLSLVTNESKALYNTHVRCVITETQFGERERYKHFSHRHLLVLLESKKSKCYACKRLNIQGQPAYGCDLCGFYRHQSCFELQR
ncbi:hypothetical protein CUMW_207950 [Citrus unshiu]|uniref:DC1 domain-containing protein n=1 Tax=Citrus unshiu TaxID=55188 RepID=A0A2H5Q977_CITUN|nr:hypothetical protein CUMW_207950 [Citrus unshiu]